MDASDPTTASSAPAQTSFALDAWLHRTAQRVQDSAREAAEKASLAAKKFATEVKENTKATADAAEKTFKQVVTRVETLRVDNKHLEEELELEKQERVQYGIQGELLEFLEELTLQTFQNFPEEDAAEAGKREDPTAESSATSLTNWQEKHALLVLKASPRLNDFRYRLVPRKMSDKRFWDIYFQITDKYLQGYTEDALVEKEGLVEKDVVTSTENGGVRGGTTPPTSSKADSADDSGSSPEDVHGKSEPPGREEESDRTDSGSHAEGAVSPDRVDPAELSDTHSLESLLETANLDGVEAEEEVEGGGTGEEAEGDGWDVELEVENP